MRDASLVHARNETVQSQNKPALVGAEMEGKDVKTRVVVCAANRSIVNGKIVCGARHWDNIMRGQVADDSRRGDATNLARKAEWLSCEQGFIDQFGVWMDRKEAYSVAMAANQIKYPLPGREGTLYSENLY